MAKGRESVCCKEVDRVNQRVGNLICITDHDAFKALCLNHHVVEASIYKSKFCEIFFGANGAPMYSSYVVIMQRLSMC